MASLAGNGSGQRRSGAISQWNQANSFPSKGKGRVPALGRLLSLEGFMEGRLFHIITFWTLTGPTHRTQEAGARQGRTRGRGAAGGAGIFHRSPSTAHAGTTFWRMAVGPAIDLVGSRVRLSDGTSWVLPQIHVTKRPARPARSLTGPGVSRSLPRTPSLHRKCRLGKGTHHGLAQHWDGLWCICPGSLRLVAMTQKPLAP